MEIHDQTSRSATVTLTSDELVMVNNALNEVCNGFDIGDDEFSTRLGFGREQLRELLEHVGGLVGQMNRSG